jgi:hypothetical protein
LSVDFTDYSPWRGMARGEWSRDRRRWVLAPCYVLYNLLVLSTFCFLSSQRLRRFSSAIMKHVCLIFSDHSSRVPSTSALLEILLIRIQLGKQDSRSMN